MAGPERSADKPQRIWRTIRNSHSKSGVTSSAGGRTTVLRRGQTRLPDFKDRNALAACRGGDRDVPSWSPSRDDPVDWEMEEPDIPALHQDPSPATDARRGDRDDDEPRFLDSRTGRSERRRKVAFQDEKT